MRLCETLFVLVQYPSPSWLFHIQNTIQCVSFLFINLSLPFLKLRPSNPQPDADFLTYSFSLSPPFSPSPTSHSTPSLLRFLDFYYFPPSGEKCQASHHYLLLLFAFATLPFPLSALDPRGGLGLWRRHQTTTHAHTHTRFWRQKDALFRWSINISQYRSHWQKSTPSFPFIGDATPFPSSPSSSHRKTSQLDSP